MSIDRKEFGSGADDNGYDEPYEARDEIADIVSSLSPGGPSTAATGTPEQGTRGPTKATLPTQRDDQDAADGSSKAADVSADDVSKAGANKPDASPMEAAAAKATVAPPSEQDANAGAGDAAQPAAGAGTTPATGASAGTNGAGSAGAGPAGAGAVSGAVGQRVRAVLRASLGEDIYTSWFGALEFGEFDGAILKVTVPTKFLRNWISQHYTDALLASAAVEFKGVKKVDVTQRLPAAQGVRQPQPLGTRTPADAGTADGRRPAGRPPVLAPGAPAPRTLVNGLEGSPLDPRYTLESFAVGPANRMAHAGATQVAETIFADERGFNPFFIHSSVGHGKTHLLHAIAWEVKRRTPHAQVLYLTAERFRFQFVEAVKAQDAMAFKEKFRAIDLLLIDDLEFLQGEKTELEFDHVINMLLDGGRQLVVASARPPSQLVRLNDRMRSRLGRGLVTEIGALDYELRLKILERRIADKRSVNPSFEIPRDGVELLANTLKESGRELEGAVTRLFAMWQYMAMPITVEVVQNVIGELVNGAEPRRIKIEDILRIISRHYGVSRADILSQRRHRSVVWPRQIGMYLAKQLTSRSLPEIGRRFGGRDHTTVLHAIRKVDGELSGNTRLKDEIEELKKQLSIP